MPPLVRGRRLNAGDSEAAAPSSLSSRFGRVFSFGTQPHTSRGPRLRSQTTTCMTTLHAASHSIHRRTGPKRLLRVVAGVIGLDRRQSA